MGTINTLVPLFNFVSYDKFYVVYPAAIGWALSDTIVKNLNSSIHGNLFIRDQDAGFAALRLFESLGYVAAFG